MTNLAERVLWFLGHLDATPTRMHCRGVWVDRDTNLGSQLGSPALDAKFERWLYAVQARTTDVLEVVCHHVGVARPCPTCSVLVNGEPYETGTRRVERECYRWPMRALIARLDGCPVPRGRPRLSEVLFALDCTGGDLTLAARALSHRYPAMGDPATALAHFDKALREAEAKWREDAPVRLLPKLSKALDVQLASR